MVSYTRSVVSRCREDLRKSVVWKVLVSGDPVVSIINDKERRIDRVIYRID